MLHTVSFGSGAAIDYFICNRLNQIVDLGHPLAVLANRMSSWEIEASPAQYWERQVKDGKKIDDLYLFGPICGFDGGRTANAGRPRVPTQLNISTWIF
jgi:IS5 family transposase